MRITTLNAYQAGIDNLLKRQGELTDSQVKLTSGKRVQRASDDPTAAARAERALATVARSEASQRALDASRNAMTLTESALADADDLVQRARETMVAAGNASYSDAERAGLAKNLESIRSQLLSVANRGDGAGGYLFAGQGGSQPPFLDAPGGVQYRGTAGSTEVSSGEPLPLTVDGRASWLESRSGNGVFTTRAVSSTTAWIDTGRVTDPSKLTGATYRIDFAVTGGATTYAVLKDGVAMVPPVGGAYASGRAIEVDGMSLTVNGSPADGDRFESAPSTPSLSIFDTLDRAIAQLQTPLRTPSQVTQGAQNALRDLDASASSLQGLRAGVGETLTRADAVEGRLSASKLYGETERSNAENLDLVQAISDFKTQQNGYDAALQTYSKVQRLSLFQYLS